MNILKFLSLSCLLLPAMGLNAMNLQLDSSSDESSSEQIEQFSDEKFDKNYQKDGQEGRFSSVYSLPGKTYNFLWKKASWGKVAAEGCVLGLLGAGIAYKCNKTFRTKVNDTVEKIKKDKESRSALRIGTLFSAGVLTGVGAPALYKKLYISLFGLGAYYGHDEQ
ncbi:hypothetical protein H0X06_03855 [Candidatus Dependentiae bacterium]|nr:hypothetical protein [Candidatus Dependentiae bacterium]